MERKFKRNRENHRQHPKKNLKSLIAQTQTLRLRPQTPSRRQNTQNLNQNPHQESQGVRARTINLHCNLPSIQKIHQYYEQQLAQYDRLRNNESLPTFNYHFDYKDKEMTFGHHKRSHYSVRKKY